MKTVEKIAKSLRQGASELSEAEVAFLALSDEDLAAQAHIFCFDINKAKRRIMSGRL
ncbi:MAG: hypothetical protein SGJ17_04040 [Hyphomicrobiales bacterium]|nr:hypothetical protein [Hyphomicrobiales bacterium]